MAAFNASATIGAAVRSVLDQTMQEFELLVIDGASRDGTADIVRAFGDPRIVVVSEPDRGIYDAMNKGLDRFRGDAVGFLNSDDRYHDRGVLQDIVDALEVYPAVQGHLDFVDEEERIRRRWRATPHRPGAFARGWMPAHPTFYVRRQVALTTGKFNLDWKIGADYDWMLRAISTDDMEVGLIDRVLVDMRLGGASTSGIGAYVRANLEALKSRQMHLGSGVVDVALFAKPLRKLTQWL